MHANRLKSCAGFTFIAALFIVVVIGIMLAGTGQTWQMAMQREREEELLFRGSQIRDAIGRWKKAPAGPGAITARTTKISELKDLLEDPHSQGKVRFLRRLYKDPITNKDFTLIRDKVDGGIIGVASPSTDKPLKQANFPEEFKEFGNKEKYSDWQFTYKPPTSKPGSTPTGSTETGPNAPITLPPVPPPPTN